MQAMQQRDTTSDLDFDQAKLLRLCWAIDAVLGETDTSTLDPVGRRQLGRMIERWMVEVGAAVSEDLLQELARCVPLPSADEPSSAEIRLAEAQLLGWLLGLLLAEPDGIHQAA